MLFNTKWISRVGPLTRDHFWTSSLFLSHTHTCTQWTALSIEETICSGEKNRLLKTPISDWRFSISGLCFRFREVSCFSPPIVLRSLGKILVGFRFLIFFLKFESDASSKEELRWSRLNILLFFFFTSFHRKCVSCKVFDEMSQWVLHLFLRSN